MFKIKAGPKVLRQPTFLRHQQVLKNISISCLWPHNFKYKDQQVFMLKFEHW